MNHQNEEKTIRVCPVCSTSQVKLMRKIKGEGNIFHIVRCRNCSFVYVANPNEKSINDGSEPNAIPVKSRHYLIKKVIGSLSKKGRKVKILEVGCGWGPLASLVSKDEKFHYVGYEPSTVRSSYCTKHGLKVINDFFQLQKDEVYDVAILDNVLEHVHDPVGLMKQVVSSIVKGGCIIVIVPNLHDIRRLIPRWRKWHYWAPEEHINYFTFRDLKSVFHNLGLEINTFPLLPIREHGALRFAQSVLDMLNLHILGHYVIGRKE